MTDRDELLDAARAAARAASELLRGVRPEHIRAKGNPRDLVTEWDVRSEETIRAVLAERTPGIAVLGEEAGQGAATTGDLRWIVDPIDGTVNFAHGLPIWSISIALEHAGQIDVGVVTAPRLGWWFEASRGGGAYFIAEDPRDATRGGGNVPASPGPMGRESARWIDRLQVSATPRLAQSLLVSGFPYDLASRPDNNFAEWEHFQRTAGACRRLGSAAIDLCLVARGWMDGYWERLLKPWDVAAGSLIVAEAGGTITDYAGDRFDPHEGEVVASNGAIHGEVLAELARVPRR